MQKRRKEIKKKTKANSTKKEAKDIDLPDPRDSKIEGRLS